MPINSAQLYGAIEPVVRDYYGLEVNSSPAQYSQIAETDTTDEPIMDFVEFGGPGQLQFKAENAAVQLSPIRQGPIKRVQAATYAGGIELSLEVVADVKYGKVKSAAKSLGRATRLTPEYLFAQFLDRSFDTTFPVTADGINLCSASHLLPDGTTASNIITAAALAESSLEDMTTALRTVPGPDGMLSPEEKRQIVVPSALNVLAEKLSSSTKTLGSANNDPSVVKGTKVVVFDFLTNNTRWFMQTKNDRGIFWKWRQKAEFLRDNPALTLQAIFVAYFRAMWGCEDWRGVFGSNAV